MLLLLFGSIALGWLTYALPLNRPELPKTHEKSMILIHNGNHIDLVFPRQDFFEVAPPPFQTYRNAHPSRDWVAVGWGDTQFMLYHGTIDTVTFRDVWRAAFHSESSAIRLSFRDRPRNRDQAEVFLSAANQRQLIHNIALSDGNLIRWDYQEEEVLLRSPVHYWALRTCNDWVAKALRSVDLPTPAVVTTSSSIMRYYRD